MQWNADKDAQGLSRKDHIRRHNVDDPNRNVAHWVFNENGINQTANAWGRSQDMGLQPTIQGNRWVYDVPSPNAGWGKKEILNYQVMGRP